VPRSDTGGGGGVRGVDGLSLGMTSGSHQSASAGAGEGGCGAWRAGWAERLREAGLQAEGSGPRPAAAAGGYAGCCAAGPLPGWA
jgi:hypothetical protein